MKKFFYIMTVAGVCAALDFCSVPAVKTGALDFIAYLLLGNCLIAGFGWALYVMDKHY